jgi:protein required for attachment to host cells
MQSDKMTWVILTDSANCRIYEFQKSPKQLTLIKEINHSENRLRDIDITSDKPGHYKAANSQHGAYTQETDPKENQIDVFSREISRVLDHGRTTNAYENLIIIAAPHMTGLLNKHFNKHVKELVSVNIEKDLVHLRDNELLGVLNGHG